jgi:hypothetical protein
MVLDTIRIIEGKEDWEDVLREIGSYDFYHTYDYHQILPEKGHQYIASQSCFWSMSPWPFLYPP